MNQFWVDPEGLGRSGSGYSEVQDQVNSIQQDLSNILATYSGSYGDTPEDLQFQQNFQDGIGQYRDGIGGFGQQVGSIADGLTMNSRTYGDSRDSANTATYQFLTQGQQAGYGQDQPGDSSTLKRGEVQPDEPWMRQRVEVQPEEPRTLKRGEVQPQEMGWEPQEQLLPQRKDEHAKMALEEPARFVKGEEPQGETEPRQLMARHAKVEQVRGTTPISTDGYGLDNVDKQKIEVRPPEMFSAIAMPALRKDAPPMVDGTPLGQGQQLIFAKALPDGSAKLNVDDYSHITPVDSSKVTMGDHPYPLKDGDRAFVVTTKPGAGQTPPADQLFMDFPPDGQGGPSMFRMSSTDHS